MEYWDAVTNFFFEAWSKAEAKDIVTFSASATAVLISLMSFFQRAGEAKSSARKHLTEIIEKLHETNVENAKLRDENLRKEFPENYDRLIGDRRRFLVRQAKFLVEQIPKLVSPYERGIVAEGLASIDDSAEADLWFRGAIKRAKQEFDRVILLRQYGRYLFRNGQNNKARKQFRLACKAIGGNSDRHCIYLGDTFERWAQLEYDFGDITEVPDLLDKAGAEYRKVAPEEFANKLMMRLRPLIKKIETEEKT